MIRPRGLCCMNDSETFLAAPSMSTRTIRIRDEGLWSGVGGRAFQFGQKKFRFDSIRFSLRIDFFLFDSIRQSDKFAACTLIFK